MKYRLKEFIRSFICNKLRRILHAARIICMDVAQPIMTMDLTASVLKRAVYHNMQNSTYHVTVLHTTANPGTHNCHVGLERLSDAARGRPIEPPGSKNGKKFLTKPAQ
jgi:hypothetical protein